MMRAVFWLPGLLLLGACTTTRYGYFPVGQEETLSAKVRGATFPVRIGDAEGSVHVMSLGVVDLRSEKNGAHFPALHLRFLVHHRTGTAPWRLDAREERVELSGGRASIPAYLKTETNEPPRVTVALGEKRSLDLFYPLPPGDRRPEEFDGFTLQWRVAAGKAETKQTTAFVRQPTNRPPSLVEVNSPRQHQGMVLDEEEMSPGIWWYDSTMYPTAAFPGAIVYPALY